MQLGAAAARARWRRAAASTRGPWLAGGGARAEARARAQVVSEDAGLALDKLDLNALGRAKKVTISKDDTIVLDGAGEKAAIAERCDQLRESIDASQSDYDREKLQARRRAPRLCFMSGSIKRGVRLHVRACAL